MKATTDEMHTERNGVNLMQNLLDIYCKETEHAVPCREGYEYNQVTSV
jgi:hypothetical protein